MTVSLAAIEAAIDRAHTEVGRVCTPGERWRMSIPADSNRDSDLIISDALVHGEKLAAAIRAVISVCQNTDGDWLDPSAEIPVGEVLRMLAEAGIDLDGVSS